MKQRWGVLRTAVILQGMKKPKVSAATEEQCSSSATSSRSFPYPTEFAKPQYPTKFEKPHYPTEFAKPHYPTEFVGPNQSQTQTQTSLPETLSRWDKAIHQLVLQADMGKEPVSYDKAAADENASESKTETARNRWGKVAHQLVNENNRSKRLAAQASVSYCPSLPSPEGPFPPPAFAYNSPAHAPKIISEPEEAENAPAPAYSRWNNVIQQLSKQAKNGKDMATSQSENPTGSNIYPSLPSPPPTITCNSPEDEILCATKLKTA